MQTLLAAPPLPAEADPAGLMPIAGAFLPSVAFNKLSNATYWAHLPPGAAGTARSAPGTPSPLVPAGSLPFAERCPTPAVGCRSTRRSSSGAGWGVGWGLRGAGLPQDDEEVTWLNVDKTWREVTFVGSEGLCARRGLGLRSWAYREVNQAKGERKGVRLVNEEWDTSGKNKPNRKPLREKSTAQEKKKSVADTRNPPAIPPLVILQGLDPPYPPQTETPLPNHIPASSRQAGISCVIPAPAAAAQLGSGSSPQFCPLTLAPSPPLVAFLQPPPEQGRVFSTLSPCDSASFNLSSGALERKKKTKP